MSANPQFPPEPDPQSPGAGRVKNRVGVYDRPSRPYAKWVLLAILAVLLVVLLRFVF